MNFNERQSALSVVRELIEAEGAQTMTEIIHELIEQADGCNNIHDGKDYAAYAIRQFKALRMLREEEIEVMREGGDVEAETFYDLV